MAEVVLDKVNKQYENGYHAVRDLDLDIAHGEFLVLVGPSGCGQSTALRMDKAEAVRLGSATLRLHPAVAQQRPALASYVARDVAVGIRLKATVSLVEALGAQIVVHFELDAPKVVTEDTKLLDKDAHTEDAPTHV